MAQNMLTRSRGQGTERHAIAKRRSPRWYHVLRIGIMTLPLLVRGACPHDCPDTCGVVTEVRDGRAVGFHGDPDHPITRGWLCAKVRPYLDHVYHPDRLMHPLRRV